MQDVFYKTIANEARIAILSFRLPDKICCFANNLAKEVLEIDQETPLEKISLADLCPKEALDYYQPFNENLLVQNCYYNELLMQKLNGHVFVANLEIKKLEVSDQYQVLLMFQDVSFEKRLQREINAKQAELHNAYQDLLAQNQQLKDLDVAKDRFIAMTTHELRTPLSAIVAAGEVLTMKLYDNEEQLQEFLQIMYGQAKQLLELVNDILDFAKIRSGKMQYYVKEHLISPILKEQVEGLDQLAKTAKVKLELLQAPNEKPCYFDEVRIKQVVNNIINNAIKFNKEDGFVRVGLTQDDDFTRVIINDGGIGIEAQNIPKIFDEFETLGAVSKHHKGTGLGMPIALRIMKAIGGDLQVESVYGVGSTFSVLIPNKKILSNEFYKGRPNSQNDLLQTVVNE